MPPDCVLPCRFGATVPPSGSPYVDDGIVYYGGTIELITSSHPAGAAEVRFFHGQSFMKDDAGAYLANIIMEGDQSEHEEETGRLTLHDHAFNQDLDIAEVSDQPFRELWMRAGRQSFDPLIQLETT